MSDIVKLRTRAEIDEEAAQWTWRMDGEEVAPGDREAFETWLRQDVRHRRAFEEFSRVWRMLDGWARPSAMRNWRFSRTLRGARRLIRRHAGGSVPLRPFCSARSPL